MTVQKSLFPILPMRWPSSAQLRLLVGTLGITMGVGCGEQHDARAEAEALMTSLNAVSEEGSFVERSAALGRLNQLQLHFPTHAQAREVCSAAHKGLLEAEIAQTEARRALSTSSASATNSNPGGPPTSDANAPLDQAQAESIAADIERSNKALATAKQRFPECEAAMRNLLRESR